jgi:hypothetical protein
MSMPLSGADWQAKMLERDHTPQAKYWALPLMAGVVLGVFAFSFQRLAVSQVLLGVAGVFGIWWLVNFVQHITHVANELRLETREIEYRFTDNAKAETIARMNDGQLKAWMRSGRVGIGVQPSEKRAVDFVNGERFFLYTVWYMLKMSDQKKLYPIHNFKQDTYHFDMWGDHDISDYEQAKLITAYLVRYGWVTWALGNSSATFTGDNNPEKVMSYFGLRRDSYDPDVPESE